MPSATPAPASSAAPTSTSGADPRALPPYQAPTQPLSRKAQDKLARLAATEYDHDLFNRKYKAAISALGEDGGDISERLVERRDLITRNQKRRQREGKADAALDAAEAADLADLELKVTGMTKRMESAVRRAIDGQTAVAQLQTAHAAVTREANDHATAAAATATQQTQRSAVDAQPQVPQDGATPAPTQPAPRELLPLFEEKLEAAQDRYQAKSLYQRYAEHNDYVGFRKIMHAASYPAEAEPPPLPHAATWFADAEPQLGVTATARGDDDADNDDVAVGQWRISTKCPLTLTEFEDPLTSRKCPHSFERSAILSMIERERPPTRRGGGRDPDWRQEVQCPVPGCVQMLGKNDLERDEVLVRKIKRIQRARELEEEENGAGFDRDGDARMGGDEIDSDSGDDIDAVTQRQSQSQRQQAIKRERASQRRQDDVIDDDDDDNADDGDDD